MTRSDILALREIAVSTMDDARQLRWLNNCDFPSATMAADDLHSIGARLMEKSYLLEAELDRQILETVRAQ